ncbi:mediator of RNA polymerase II transcription subunit 25-like isoform X1 [Salvia splendens]|uniref:mediator of RNA polymerase II transcription subunit 25-like isoform X1 n=2 Tax=Salvia splendens TaxID=180675 RepID=UPI001C2610C8|nr:mediator of RNA polymerase II transcription subunit 25-like isoform X1 [Salvia splendens]
MAAKQLIIVVEGTAATGPFWQTIFSDYLDKIIRCFCGDDSIGQETSTPQVELSLVVFTVHGPYSACLVRRTGWTRNMDLLLHWLSVIPFAGGGFSDAAIAEGLGEALMMFSTSNGNQNQNMESQSQRHCILIAASNPYPLPTPVYGSQSQRTEQSDNTETPTDNRLFDAEAVAKSFAQSAISLSVICPRKLPKLGAIYNAGKNNPRATDPPPDNVKNPHFLVLISDNFVEARIALTRSGLLNLPSNQNPVKMDVTPTGPAPLMSGPLPSAVAKPASQAVASLQTSSPISTSQEMAPNTENAQDMKPLVNNTTPSLPPVGGAAANVRILNDVAQASQVLANGTSIALPSMGGTPMLPNMMSSGMTSSVPSAQIVMSSGPSAVASITRSLPIPAATTQMAQIGMGMNQNMMSDGGTSGIPSGNDSMMPTPGMSQPMQPGMEPVGVNGSVVNMPINQQTSSTMPPSLPIQVKFWEGNLSGQRQGKPVFITRLVGYRKSSASETLGANWPPTLQMVRLISQDHMNNKKYAGKGEFLVFRAMDQHGFLDQLKDKKLCAVIQLPSQTLLLSHSYKALHLTAKLYPGIW